MTTQARYDSAHLHTVVVIEIATGRQRLAGTIRPVDGDSIRFSGWLELAASIERLRLQASEAPSQRSV